MKETTKANLINQISKRVRRAKPIVRDMLLHELRQNSRRYSVSTLTKMAKKAKVIGGGRAIDTGIR